VYLLVIFNYSFMVYQYGICISFSFIGFLCIPRGKVFSILFGVGLVVVESTTRRSTTNSSSLTYLVEGKQEDLSYLYVLIRTYLYVPIRTYTVLQDLYT
jgi:hypothetical protein